MASSIIHSAPFGLPSYQDFPLHLLIGAVLIYAFRKTIIELVKVALGFCFLVLAVVLFIKTMTLVNYLIPLGVWWCAVFAVLIVILTFLPALLEVVFLLFYMSRGTYRLIRSLFIQDLSNKHHESKEKKSNFSEQSTSRNRERPGYDPYSILGIRTGASFNEVRDAYLYKMKNNHPDRVANLDPVLQEFANERAKLIQNAFEALKARAS